MKTLFELCPSLMFAAIAALALAFVSALGWFYYLARFRNSWRIGACAVLCIFGIISCSVALVIAQETEAHALALSHGFERVQVYTQGGKPESIVFTLSEAHTNKISILGQPAEQVEPAVKTTLYSMNEIRAIQRWLQSKDMAGAKPLQPLAELAGK